ncbi:MAG: hypothetical protein LBK95_11615 [Bifidobacteriaceae bacterium]|jgi:hypothetical protein|nr:hypothetical protein [Bifidobacteriaceae bacterium]
MNTTNGVDTWIVVNDSMPEANDTAQTIERAFKNGSDHDAAEVAVFVWDGDHFADWEEFQRGEPRAGNRYFRPLGDASDGTWLGELEQLVDRSKANGQVTIILDLALTQDEAKRAREERLGELKFSPRAAARVLDELRGRLGPDPTGHQVRVFVTTRYLGVDRHAAGNRLRHCLPTQAQQEIEARWPWVEEVGWVSGSVFWRVLERDLPWVKERFSRRNRLPLWPPEAPTAERVAPRSAVPQPV